MIYIETPRLTLRDWDTHDLPSFIKMNQDSDVMRFFPKLLSPAETTAFYERILHSFRENGYGLYAVEEKASGEFIGFIGFNHASFEAPFTPCIEIGWRLRKEAWGKGYATEGAKACLAYGFNQLPLEEIVSFTAKINKPSIQVMKKLGLTYVQTFEHPTVALSSPLREHVLYQTKRS
ncbi:acetyltransferase, GNAT family [Bacillus sp. JCM 19045]|nr:acetyltransferase, GNAT family [Bacillus sp. JCM 19045]